MTAHAEEPAAWLARGHVVHKRLRPRQHALQYRTLALLVDLDRLEDAQAACRLLGCERPAALGLHARDHFDGTRQPLAVTARRLFADAGIDVAATRLRLLTYPRMLGYVFNPLSVYLLSDRDERLRAVLYEVSNTFGERVCYIEPVATAQASEPVIAQATVKRMFVSPFAPNEGHYTFRLERGPHTLTVGVAYRDADGPLIKTHQRCSLEPLTTRAAARALAAMPAMTFKVMLAIHWEAAKLWWKGVPLHRRRRTARFAVAPTKPMAPPTVTADNRTPGDANPASSR
jgi:hypothetical protein